MLAALAGVIYLIYSLRTTGISEGGLLAAGDLNWCKTRVKSLVNEGENVSIEQQGSDWKVLKPADKILEPTFMEKWLGANCKVSVDSYVSKYVLPGGQTELVVTFIDGTQTRFIRTEPATFMHQGDVLKSRQLEEAWHVLNRAAR
ncbi:MAG: hypothetical protein ABL958_18735 [Bdellovibrionia bacterium]